MFTLQNLARKGLTYKVSAISYNPSLISDACLKKKFKGKKLRNMMYMSKKSALK